VRGRAGQSRRNSNKNVRKNCRKSSIFHIKWSQNGAHGRFGRERASGSEKGAKGNHRDAPFGVTFEGPGHQFRAPFFDAFSGGVFFAPWAGFESPKCPKGSQNEPKMEPKGCLRASSGKCKKHGRHCTGGIWGGLGEGPGGDLLEVASPDPLWRGL
jgi:hypothetical protein